MGNDRDKPRVELIPPGKDSRGSRAVDVDQANDPAVPPASSPRRASPFKSLLSVIPGVPTLLGLYAFMLDGEADSMSRFKLFAAFVYLLSPIDIIPEFFTAPLGFADDAAVLVWIVQFSLSPGLRTYRSLARQWLRGKVQSLDVDENLKQ